jgi:hypothetical protein
MSFPVIPVKRRENMLKKQLTLLFASAFTFSLAAMVVFGQQAPAKSKEARWEGRIERSSKEKSSLTVRKGNLEKTCVYDSSTKWVSQYHADKKVNDIDSSQVKDGDYVICKGTSESAGVIHATLISKRLSHSPQ